MYVRMVQHMACRFKLKFRDEQMVMGYKHRPTAETPSNLNTHLTHLVAISCNKYKQWESENFIVSIITASILFASTYWVGQKPYVRTYVRLKMNLPRTTFKLV